jgi:hypothetical protein
MAGRALVRAPAREPDAAVASRCDRRARGERGGDRGRLRGREARLVVGVGAGAPAGRRSLPRDRGEVRSRLGREVVGLPFCRQGGRGAAGRGACRCLVGGAVLRSCGVVPACSSGIATAVGATGTARSPHACVSRTGRASRWCRTAGSSPRDAGTTDRAGRRTDPSTAHGCDAYATDRRRPAQRSVNAAPTRGPGAPHRCSSCRRDAIAVPAAPTHARPQPRRSSGAGAAVAGARHRPDHRSRRAAPRRANRNDAEPPKCANNAPSPGRNIRAGTYPDRP